MHTKIKIEKNDANKRLYGITDHCSEVSALEKELSRKRCSDGNMSFNS